MTLHTWGLFLMMAFVVSGTPGPNMLMVMSHGTRHGLRPTFATMAGCMTALLAMMSLSAAGLGALLQVFPPVFDALRWTGAAYLAYLGFKSWRSPAEGALAPAETGSSRKAAGAGALYRQGFLVAASNPKAILFAAAFFPQFIDPALPKLPQFAILLATFSVVEVSWYVVYASCGRGLAGYLRRPAVGKAFNRLTGGAFIGFAAAMAAAPRS